MKEASDAWIRVSRDKLGLELSLDEQGLLTFDGFLTRLAREFTGDIHPGNIRSVRYRW